MKELYSFAQEKYLFANLFDNEELLKIKFVEQLFQEI